jgi:hypothetical protein
MAGSQMNRNPSPFRSDEGRDCRRRTLVGWDSLRVNTRAIFVLTAIFAVVPGFALGQTTRTNPASSSTTRTIPSSSSTSPNAPCYSSTNPTSPCYSSTANPCYSAAAPNEPCSPPTKPSSSTAPLVPPPIATSPQAPAHAFTRDQAKSQIEAKGYSSVSGLQKDSKGIWRGNALKDGKPVNVILDLQGSVIAN